MMHSSEISQMRLVFFEAFYDGSELDIFIPTEWEDLPDSEKAGWIKAFEYAYKCGYNKGGEDTHAAQAKAFANAATGTHYDYLD